MTLGRGQVRRRCLCAVSGSHADMMVVKNVGGMFEDLIMRHSDNLMWGYTSIISALRGAEVGVKS